MKVCKFGGSSLATTEKIKQVADILEMEDSRRCAVLSAPGKSPKNVVKITDLLIKAVDSSLSGKDYSKVIDKITGIFSEIYTPLGINSSSVNKVKDELEKRLKASSEDKGKY